MRYSLIGELPAHQYVYVHPAFIQKDPVDDWIPAAWFGLVSFPSRAWGLTVMLESGAVYRNLPPHSISFRQDSARPWTLYEAQHWDCYGTDFSVIEYRYLAELRCLCRCGDRQEYGEYLFTVAPIGDGYSHHPEQAKEFSFVKLHNGRLTIQPTDRVLFKDASFTDTTMKWPDNIRRQRETYSCE